jgi:hypothetical protein
MMIVAMIMVLLPGALSADGRGRMIMVIRLGRMCVVG